MSDDVAITAASFGGTIDVGAVSGSGVTITGGTEGTLVQKMYMHWAPLH